MIIERMKKTNPGETICLSYEECEEILGMSKRPVAHWVLTGRKNVYCGIEVVCSYCNSTVMVSNVSDEKYCRTCGAMMEVPPKDGEQEAQQDYERSVEYAQYCERYEPTYNPEDGSM